MAKDARKIIKSIDPNALIATPSSTVGNVGSEMLANFLYCNQNPRTQCTMGSAGSAAVDIIADQPMKRMGSLKGWIGLSKILKAISRTPTGGSHYG
jgi:hypothetical protein